MKRFILFFDVLQGLLLIYFIQDQWFNSIV